MCFLNDGLVRRLLGLVPATSSDPLEDPVPVEEIKVLGDLEEHRLEFHNYEDEFNESLKREAKDDYFKIERLDEYINHYIKFDVPVSKSMVKFIFLSYIFSVHNMRKQVEIINRKDDQVVILFKLCNQYKDKLR